MLTTVATFRDPWEAQLFRLRLEAEGVAAFVAHDHHIGMNWQWSTALGGAKVQVLDEEAADALSIARRCRAGDFRAELLDMFGDIDEPHCPACGSGTFEQRHTYPLVVLSGALFMLAGVIVPPWRWVRRCRACGTRWVE